MSEVPDEQVSVFNTILEEGKIVDNKRVKSLNMKEVLKIFAQESEGFKCAVGYFYIEGLVEIINSIKDIQEIKILMGYETSKPTKQELVNAFTKKFDELEDNEQIKPAIKLFYQLIQEYQTLKIRVYFGDEKPERLHSKGYLFLRNTKTENLIDRYKAAIVGSSNLTPSGLVGNTELNTIINDPIDLKAVETWFDSLWEKGTEDFEKLKVSEAIVKAIEKSKFKKGLKDSFLYIKPREFFKILIKFLNADYLFEEFKKSKLFKFQYVDFIRCLDNFNSKGYKGCFLTSSVGLGKSYVASQIAKYFIHNGQKVLIIAPAGLVHNEEQWPRYLKEFEIYDKVTLESMGKLQFKPDNFKLNKYSGGYGLIIVDEAHNYRNEDSYRTRNLKKIIDENGDSKVLFLTATPINTRLDDLSNLIKLFYRKGQNLFFDKLVRDLDDLTNLLKVKDYEELTDKEKKDFTNVQEEIEKEIFVKSTGATIKTSEEYIKELKTFTGIDIRDITDPEVKEIKYELDSEYRYIVNGIVEFISSLSLAHLRIIDPDKGVRLGGIFKWVLYKRFESDISSYFLTLKRLSKRNIMILKALEYKKMDFFEEDEYEDDIEINFDYNFKEKLNIVINKIKLGDGEDHLKILEELKKDTICINNEIKKLEPFLKEGSNILFKNDQKINQLDSALIHNNNKNILIFTQYADTLKAIKEYFKDSFDPEEIKFVTSDTNNKQSLIEKFNNPKDKLRILISTDTLSEGFNIGGADIVINFDIPYNPVKIIQRIGRATRLDNPKKIDVLNFRPADDIDVELKLVKTMELRIKDIIRFIGVEYRIWFDAEKELLKERRKLDKKIYLEILNKIRANMRKGNFEKLDVSINYSKPILILLQKGIQQYKLNLEEIRAVKIPNGKKYTLLKGEKGLNIIYQDSSSFNEKILLGKDVIETDKRINFEKVYKDELKSFYHYKDQIDKEKLRLEYYNDSMDRMINTILDYISREKIAEIYPDISKLEEDLCQIRDKCGSTTEIVIKKIKREITVNRSQDKIDQWIKELEDSYTKNDAQQKFSLKESLFAIGFIEG